MLGATVCLLENPTFVIGGKSATNWLLWHFGVWWMGINTIVPRR
jgi:hypothetical protein